MPDSPAHDEIEVTDEMVEAGVLELLAHDVYPDSAGAGPSMSDWRDAFSAALRASLQFRGGQNRP